MIKRIIPGQSMYYYGFAGEENHLFEPIFPEYSRSSSMNAADSILIESQTVEVQSGPVSLQGILNTPNQPNGLVMFVDSESHRHQLHQSIAYNLLSAGLATLTFDLLTAEEQEQEALSAGLYADTGLLVRRTIGAMDWISQQPPFQNFRLGCFGSRIGAPAALIAAAERPEITGAVVWCGGQIESGTTALTRLHTPVLFVVGGRDQTGYVINQQAFAEMDKGAWKEVRVVDGASDLFEEPDTYETVVKLCTGWFKKHLQPAASR